MRKLLFLILSVILFWGCNKEEDSGSYQSGHKKYPVPEAVDLGIVVDGKTILWASCNLCAAQEYEMGEFFAWGEISPREENAPYRLGLGFSWYYPSDYLAPEDDAAHVLLGGKWRIPTESELQALINTRNDTSHYSWEVIIPKDREGNDVLDDEGIKLRGLRISYVPNGNSIFIPFQSDISSREEHYFNFYYSSNRVVGESFGVNGVSFVYHRNTNALQEVGTLQASICPLKPYHNLIRPVCE